jgi:hypothetical protein
MALIKLHNKEKKWEIFFYGYFTRIKKDLKNLILSINNSAKALAMRTRLRKNLGDLTSATEARKNIGLIGNADGYSLAPHSHKTSFDKKFNDFHQANENAYNPLHSAAHALVPKHCSAPSGPGPGPDDPKPPINEPGHFQYNGSIISVRAGNSIEVGNVVFNVTSASSTLTLSFRAVSSNLIDCGLMHKHYFRIPDRYGNPYNYTIEEQECGDDAHEGDWVEKELVKAAGQYSPAVYKVLSHICNGTMVIHIDGSEVMRVNESCSVKQGEMWDSGVPSITIPISQGSHSIKLFGIGNSNFGLYVTSWQLCGDYT